MYTLTKLTLNAVRNKKAPLTRYIQHDYMGDDITAMIHIDALVREKIPILGLKQIATVKIIKLQFHNIVE